MNPDNDKKRPDPQLRAAAEAQLEAMRLSAPSAPSTLLVEELLYDLQVHQIELEMQNEALRETQTHLQELSDRYLDLYEFAPVGYLTLSAEGTVKESNLTAVKMLGVDRAKLLCRRFAAYVKPEDQNLWIQHFRHVKECGTSSSVELALQRGDGSVIQVQMDSIRRDIGADKKAILITLTDITRRMQAEEQLRELALAIEQSPESIVITDLGGRIKHVNEAFLRNTGYHPEEVISQNPRVLQSGKTPPETYQELWNALLQGKTWKGEFVNRRKDGSEYLEFAIVTPLRQADGRISHY
ncbi:MAG: PAS domain S-box protein, partial [Pseudomonadota bacterium]